MLDIVVESCLLLRLLLLFFLYILFRVFDQEKLFFCFHLAANVAAIEGTIPLSLVFFRLKLQIDIESFLILLYRKHHKDMGLSMVIYIFDFV